MIDCQQYVSVTTSNILFFAFYPSAMDAWHGRCLEHCNLEGVDSYRGIRSTNEPHDRAGLALELGVLPFRGSNCPPADEDAVHEGDPLDVVRQLHDASFAERRRRTGEDRSVIETN